MPNNKKIYISVPEDILISLNETEEEFSKDMRKYTAIYLYQEGKLSIGKSTELADMDRYSFESLLADNNIPISQLSEEDILNDVQRIKDQIE